MTTEPSGNSSGLRRFLPRIGSPGYHILLATVAIFILGPLGGISAAFMNFSIGFCIGGQVLAGILGSTVTLPYGPEGIVGARIAIPALVVALIGVWQTPHLVRIGWLGPTDHYRKIGFVISLGTILGAAILDISL